MERSGRIMRNRSDGAAAAAGPSGRLMAAFCHASAVLGTLLFAWFAMPVPLGILNIGNGAGMAISALMVLLGIRTPIGGEGRTRGIFDRKNRTPGYALADGRLNPQAKEEQNRRRAPQAKEEQDRCRVPQAEEEQNRYHVPQDRYEQKRCHVPIMIRGGWTLLAVSFAVAGLLSFLMIRAAAKKPSEDATVVVLGCRVYGETPSLMLVKRLEAAHAYLLSHPSADCVLSGGMGRGEDISEAEAMYRWMLEHGIDRNRLFKEDRSESTRENLRLSYELIKKEGLNPEIAIVTDGFHEYRAGLEAGRQGLSFGAVPAGSPWWLFPTFTAREYFGILYSWWVK